MHLRSALLLCFGLAACHPRASSDRAGAPTAFPDPAIAAALADPVMSDPQLTDASGAHLARSAAVPQGAPVPLDLPGAPDPATLFDPHLAPTLGLVAGAAVGARTACGAIGYSATWAARLPAETPLPRDAAVIEGAGEDRPGCQLRVVRFASAAPPDRLLAAFTASAQRGGYRIAHDRDGALRGTNAAGAILRLWAHASSGGSQADLVTFDPAP